MKERPLNLKYVFQSEHIENVYFRRRLPLTLYEKHCLLEFRVGKKSSIKNTLIFFDVVLFFMYETSFGSWENEYSTTELDIC